MRLVPLFLAILAGSSAAAPPVILISVDTLRADRLSCYGARQQTPRIDSLAKGGTLFSQASAQVPLTLPSHLSLLSSTYPFSNGVEDNGQVAPVMVTLASVLKGRGYRTAAFVGGFVLDKRFGLDQGFDVYDSPFAAPGDREAEAADLKRLGEDVVRSATEWIGKNAATPFFVFLHLFDLHTPENLPPAVRARFPGPRYEAELAYVDEVLGRFLDFLAQRALLDKALIVFLSDHGESLGQHGENTHGYFIYQSTLHVPLIIHWPARITGAPSRIDEPVSLLGVAPAILQAAGIPAPASFQGRSLINLWKAKAGTEEIYSESLYARNHFGTAGLASVRMGNWKYIHALKPELYDLAKDPREAHDLRSSEPALASSYRKRLEALQARYARRKPRALAAGPDAAAKLRSLGYLAGSAPAPQPAASAPDPKDRITDYAEYREAITFASSGRLTESNALLESILSRQPDLTEVRGLLALNQQRRGDHRSALRHFLEVLRTNPLNARAHFNAAISYSKLNQLDEAARELQDAIRITSAERPVLDQTLISAEEALGSIWLRKSEYDKAQAQFNHLLTIAPGNYEAHYNLAWLAGRAGRLDEAVVHLRAAIRSEPRNATAHNALGSVYLQQKNFQNAEMEFREAVRLDPQLAFAHYNLGLVLGHNGDRAGAARQFREALKADPRLQPAQEALNRIGQN